MKKLLTLALAVLMCVFAISALADTVSIDRTLELQFVPSKDADVIIIRHQEPAGAAQGRAAGAGL